MLPRWTPISSYSDIEACYVVSLSWAGRMWRLAERVITGDIEAYPGLVEAPSIDDQINLDSMDAGLSIPLGMVLPIDVQIYLDAGYDVDDIVGEVAIVWHRRGVAAHPWSARQVMGQGYFDDAQPADPTKPAGWLSGTLRDDPYHRRKSVVPLAAEANEDTWSGLPDSSIGARYPGVMGAPIREINATPGVVVETSGGNNTTTIVNLWPCIATQVEVYDGTTHDTLTIKYKTDGKGLQVAYVDVSVSGVLDITVSSYTIRWLYGQAFAPFGDVATPVQAAAFFLRQSGADIDLVEWIRIAQVIGLQVDGHVTDWETAGWEVARSMVSALPLSSRRDRDGWAPVIMDPHVWRSTWENTWREGGPWRRASAWQATGPAQVSRVDVVGDGGTAGVGGSSDYDGSLPHAWIRHLPHLASESVDARWAGGKVHNWTLARWRGRIGAMGWEASAWLVPSQWAVERAGDIIRLIESSGRISYCIIQRRTLSGGIWDYTLVRPRGR